MIDNLITSIFGKYNIHLTTMDVMESYTATTYCYDIAEEDKVQLYLINKAMYEINTRAGTTCKLTRVDGYDLAISAIKTKRETCNFNDVAGIATNDIDDSRLLIGLSAEKQEPLLLDFENMVHLLIAGETGSGKSVLLKNLIVNMAFKPNKYNMVMVDMKGTELTQFGNLAVRPVATDLESARALITECCENMQARYKAVELGKLTNSDLKELPKIVLIIDEYADLKLTDKTIETDIIRIAQKGRACGVHLIIATQDARREVISGLLKANLPTRIALKVGDHYKSKIILDQTGAETLLGKGDGLVKIPSQVELVHVQVPYQSDTELTETIKECESLLQYRIDGMASTTTADGENDGKNGFWQLLRIALTPFLQHPFKCLFKAWGIAFAVVALGIMFGL